MKFIKQLFSLGQDQDYQRGIEHFNAHRYREAIEAFQSVLNKKTSRKSLYFNLSKFYAAQAYRDLGTMAFAAGKYAEALEHFQKAMDLNSEHVDLSFFVGICHNNLGDFEQALEAFQTALVVDPDHLPSRMKLAVVFHNLQLWDSAAITYRSILLQKPEYADIHYRLGLALLGDGKIEDAVTSFENAVSINPNYVDARIKAGIVRAHQGDTQTAIKHLGHVIDRSPNYADVHFMMGLVLEYENRIEAAACALERAVEINPSFKDAKVKLAAIYIRLTRFQKALDLFQSAADQAEDDAGLTLAISIIRKRLDHPDPDSAEIGKVLEEVLGDSGSIPATIEKSCCQIDIAPHFTEMISLVNVAENARETLPITQMLVPLFEKHVDTHPTYPDLRHSLGMLYFRLNRLDDAEVSFQEAVRLNPNYIKARIDLLKTLKIKGDFDQALDHGEFILAKGIKYPDVFVALGETEFALGHPDKALAHAESALAVKPSYAAAYYLTGKALEKKGKREEAVLAYSQCLQFEAPKGLKRDAEEGIKRLTQDGGT
jgi:tetratricopeptide (TPR) repeat protein